MTQKVTSVRAVQNQIHKVNYSGSVDTIDTPANVRLPLHSMLEFQNDTHSITCTHCTASVAYLTLFKISPTLSLMVLVFHLYFFYAIFFGQGKISRKNFCFCKMFFFYENAFFYEPVLLHTGKNLLRSLWQALYNKLTSFILNLLLVVFYDLILLQPIFHSDFDDLVILWNKCWKKKFVGVPL